MAGVLAAGNLHPGLLSGYVRRWIRNWAEMWRVVAGVMWGAVCDEGCAAGGGLFVGFADDHRQVLRCLLLYQLPPVSHIENRGETHICLFPTTTPSSRLEHGQMIALKLLDTVLPQGLQPALGHSTANLQFKRGLTQ